MPCRSGASQLAQADRILGGGGFAGGWRALPEMAVLAHGLVGAVDLRWRSLETFGMDQFNGKPIRQTFSLKEISTLPSGDPADGLPRGWRTWATYTIRGIIQGTAFSRHREIPRGHHH